MLRRKSSFLLLFILSLTAGLWAQNRPDAPDFDVHEHYTKYEYRIAMRDGVHLFTSVYVPKDSSRPYPFSDRSHTLQCWPLRGRLVPHATRSLAGLR